MICSYNDYLNYVVFLLYFYKIDTWEIYESLQTSNYIQKKLIIRRQFYKEKKIRFGISQKIDIR